MVSGERMGEELLMGLERIQDGGERGGVQGSHPEGKLQ